MTAPSLRKNNEEVLRKSLQAEARKICLPIIQAFGDCAKAESIMVVFNCRKQNNDMQDCLSREYNETRFQEYLQERGYPKAVPAYTLADRVGDLKNSITDVFK